jgi:hypothetical protein
MKTTATKTRESARFVWRAQQIFLATRIEKWLLDRPEGVTFADIAERFPETVGDQQLDLGPSRPNIVLWTKLDPVARDTIATMINDGRLDMRMVPADAYPRESWVHLPIMNATDNPARPMWGPTVLVPNPAAFV